MDPEKLQKVTREALWNFYQVHDTTKPAAGIEIIFKKFEENPAALIEGLKKKYDATIELEPVFPEERYTKLFLLALLLAKPIQMHHAHSLMLSEGETMDVVLAKYAKTGKVSLQHLVPNKRTLTNKTLTTDMQLSVAANRRSERPGKKKYSF